MMRSRQDRGGGPNDSGSGHGYPQTEGCNLVTTRFNWFYNNNNNNNKIIIIIIIIITTTTTLFQEDNIFGRVASLTYGPTLTNVGMLL